MGTFIRDTYLRPARDEADYGISFMGREWDTFTPATVEKMRTSKAFGSDEDNPNLCGRTGWAGSAAIQYDRSAAASLKFQAWTQQWAEAVWRVLKPGAHAVVCASPRMGHRVTCGLEDAGFEIRDSLLWLYGSGFPKSLNLPGGLGTALKPAYEPVILARKPLGGRTVAQCVAEFGAGALNIDGCRLDGSGKHPTHRRPHDKGSGWGFSGQYTITSSGDLGRWPPNVALDETAAARLDAEGGTSRFFYVAKASRDERERGCEDLPQRTAGEATDRQDGSAGLESPRAGASRTHGAHNHHPTVKPVALSWCGSSRRPAASCWTHFLAPGQQDWPASRSSAAFSASSVKRSMSRLRTRVYKTSMRASRPAGRCLRRLCWTRRTRA